MSKRVDRIIEAAKLLYGNRWQKPLATVSDVSQPHLANMVAGVRDLKPDIERRIVEALIAEVKRFRKNTDRVERIAAAIIADLEKK